MAAVLFRFQQGPIVLISLVIVFLALLSSETNALTCHVCIPTMDDPLRCRNLEYGNMAEPCPIATYNTSCATLYIPVETSAAANIIFRGCAEELGTPNTVTDDLVCESWSYTRNFQFLPAVYSADRVTNRSSTPEGTPGERTEARRMLRNLFPHSDPSRINILRVPSALTRAPTPMKDMYTFANYKQTTSCFCRDRDHCNDERTNSSGRTMLSMSVLAVILLQSVYRRVI